MQNRMLSLCCTLVWRNKNTVTNGYFCLLSVSSRTRARARTHTHTHTHKQTNKQTHGLSITRICHQLLDWRHTLVESKLQILDVRKTQKFEDKAGTDSDDRQTDEDGMDRYAKYVI